MPLIAILTEMVLLSYGGHINLLFPSEPCEPVMVWLLIE